MFRKAEGLVTVPIAGAPLRWRHLLGWHPASGAAAFAEDALAHAVAAHSEAAQRNARYMAWLARAESDDMRRV